MNYHSLNHSATELDALYDEGYFHGVGSGYPKEGYEKHHADWSGLLSIVEKNLKHTVDHQIKWLDVGCAYGYLLEQAQQFSIDAYGTDISSYALKAGKAKLQKPVSEQLIRSVAENLPIRNHSFDVISFFDILEHLNDPKETLEEAVRILKPDAVIFLSTPDPIFFERHEETHFSERPPSYWVYHLQQLGFETCLRFGNQPYEIEIMAVRGEAEWKKKIQSDFLLERHSVNQKLQCSSQSVDVVARQWSDANVVNDEDWLYCLNHSHTPRKINIEIETKSVTHPDIFFNDLKLTYQANHQIDHSYIHHWEAITIKPGGFNLKFHSTDAVEFNSIKVKTETCDEKKYLLELPFDHYQRYNLISQVIDKTAQENLTILDVGGSLGDLELFCPKQSITTLDKTWEDTPFSIVYQGNDLPYEDQSFDWVISVDTLEHISSEQREHFLNELARVSKEAVIVCGPFDEPCVPESEKILQDFLQLHLKRQDYFLDEHETFVLPNKMHTRSFFEYNGFQVHELPNGFLPRWLAMQLATFSLTTVPEQHQARAKVNALYNSQLTAFDNQEPAYRYLLLAARNPLSVNYVHELLTLVSREPVQNSQAALWPLSSLIVSLTQSQIIQDKDQNLLHQAERIEQFISHLNNLNQLIEHEVEQRKQLLDHAKNLEHLLEQSNQHNDNLQKHIQQLESDITKQRAFTQQELEARNHQIEQMQEHITHLEELHQRWLDHIKNIENIVADQQQHIDNLDDHATNLQNSISEAQKHNHNLENLIQSLEQQHHQLQLKWQGLLNALNIPGQMDHQEAFTQAQAVIAQLHERVRELYESPMYKAMSKINLMPKPKTVHNENSSSHS